MGAEEALNKGFGAAGWALAQGACSWAIEGGRRALPAYLRVGGRLGRGLGPRGALGGACWGLISGGGGGCCKLRTERV